MNPRVHITEIKKDNPITAPMFSMVMRKHVAGGRILDIRQPNFERIIVIDVESMNEMGDLGVKHIITEIMGKHSNIILVDENDKILDSIKHVSHDKSSVREVLPGGVYVYPPSQGKINPLEADFDIFNNTLKEKASQTLQAIIYKSFTGISPAYASEICHNSGFDSSNRGEQLNENDIKNLWMNFSSDISRIKNGEYTPNIVFDKNGNVVDFFSLSSKQYAGFDIKDYESFSELLENFYKKRDNLYHVRQRAHDVRRIVVSNIERCVKKNDIQQKALKDTENREKYRLYGELITANIYSVEPNSSKLIAQNYYEADMPEIEIPLDPMLTPTENATKYFNRYNKSKRTYAATILQKEQNDAELNYLESVLSAIDASDDDSDISEIRRELISEGYIRAKKQDKSKGVKKTKPLHFVSSDGFDIYAGKSNIQNDELTLKFADSDDMWLHTKNIPGSHVIIKCGEQPVPDRTIEEAAVIAAYYSKAKDSSKVPVDFTPRRYVKKPNGAKPGMVIYVQNRTAYVDPDESLVNRLEADK
ncbi:putative protein YloA [bioreactor metagenome]|uniref:NFACT RNA-binding domain-containing protein n=1 Tax=bioreactor metagenome TaxID=1076179 RepID=A0A645AFV6_9ZZZZ